MDKNEIAVSTAGDLCAYLLSIADQYGYEDNGKLIPFSASRLEIRQMIVALQRTMQEAQDTGLIEKTDINEILPLTHFFAPGMYGRQVSLAKMNWAIGKIHRHAHINIVSKGKVLVLTEDGPMFITAPYTFVSSVGTKRFVLAIEDAIWTTVHATTETDLAKIEDDVIAKDYDQLGIIETPEFKEKIT